MQRADEKCLFSTSQPDILKEHEAGCVLAKTMTIACQTITADNELVKIRVRQRQIITLSKKAGEFNDRAASLKEQIAAANAKLSSIDDRIAEHTDEMARNEKEKNDAQMERELCLHKVSFLNGQISLLNAQICGEQTIIDAQEKQIQECNEKIAMVSASKLSLTLERVSPAAELARLYVMLDTADENRRMTATEIIAIAKTD